jgi:hypothetical protein
MFVWQNKNGNVCITFTSNKPVDNPEYVFVVDKTAELLSINNTELNKKEVSVLTENAIYETAVEVAEDVAIDLNGCSISIPDDTVGDGVFRVTSGGKLTIAGKGTVNGVGKNDYNMAIWADGGDVHILDGHFTNKGATGDVDPAHFDLIYAKNGSVVEIDGGVFECETPQWTLNNNDKNPGTFIVRGGTFIDYDPSNSQTEPAGAINNFVAEGYKVVKKGNEYTVVKA